ncbi:Rve domain-containing protein [Abeliophyllum distichum]|uniref:Rve domain-containing protein n=1 Tax=Abeliophyllum distichum TaxID=126358 RepID=A0ABD1U083_9LAMI
MFSERYTKGYAETIQEEWLWPKKVLKQGYFWPTLKKDALTHVRKCDKCQRFATIPRQPHQELTAVSSPWPFAKWGLDFIGPMPRGRGNACHAIVAIDYFTKWVEAEPMMRITEANTSKVHMEEHHLPFRNPQLSSLR